jgi:hypothetical protein
MAFPAWPCFFFDEAGVPSGPGINLAPSLSYRHQSSLANEWRKSHERKICAESRPDYHQPEREKVPALREETHREVALPCMHKT